MFTKNDITEANAVDLGAIKKLLASYHLPLDDIDNSNIRFYLVKEGKELKACAGVESFQNLGLLRSVAVNDSFRGQGIGKKLIEFILEDSGKNGMVSLYLLTETAEHFFSRLGFTKTERDQAPESIKKSSEFAELCPVSAVLMKKDLA